MEQSSLLPVSEHVQTEDKKLIFACTILYTAASFFCAFSNRLHIDENT